MINKTLYYRTYTLKNCEMECEARIMLDFCKCVLYFMPSKYSIIDNVNILSKHVVIPHYSNFLCLPENKTTRVCGKADAKCYNNIRKYMPEGK